LHSELRDEFLTPLRYYKYESMLIHGSAGTEAHGAAAYFPGVQPPHDDGRAAGDE